ncbi:hypothetical protein K438DRAFT_2002042 [Mycena galopus ATCC 62051]|nr:hypothetical protein K438DRAFT_2002042 [Mycena galopus ATCC 62051]
MPVNTHSTSLIRTSSPAASKSSDIYYDNPVFHSADDALGAYDSDMSASVSDTHNTTPTPQPIRAASSASVVEILEEDFPLATLVPTTTATTRGKATKKDKGKKRAIQARTTPSSQQTWQTLLPTRSASTIPSKRQPPRPLPCAGDTAPRPHPHPHPHPTCRCRTCTCTRRCCCARAAAAAAAVPAPTIMTPAPTAATLTPTTVTAPDAAVAVVATETLTIAVPSTFAAAVAVAPGHAVLPNHVPAPAPMVPAQHIAAAAAAAHMNPVWPTADSNPPRGSYTPTPPGGFPSIDVPHPKFLLTVSRGNGLTMHTHGLIHDSIGNYVNVDATNFQLGTPPTAERGPSPTLWLVAGLPERLSEMLVDKKVLSSTHITFFTIPFDIPITGFVGTFSGFTLPNTQEGADAACSLLQSAIRADNNIA